MQYGSFIRDRTVGGLEMHNEKGSVEEDGKENTSFYLKMNSLLSIWQCTIWISMKWIGKL